MLETITVHLGASLDRVRPIDKADESEPLGQPRISVLGQEDSGDTAKPLEHIAQFSLLCHLGHL